MQAAASAGVLLACIHILSQSASRGRGSRYNQRFFFISAMPIICTYVLLVIVVDVHTSLVPQTVLALRSSDGFSRDQGGRYRVRPRRSHTHFDR